MAHDSGLDDDGPYCRICGAHEELVDCFQCCGDGGFHDCGECTCNCLDKDEITVDCVECDGRGMYRECTSLPHTDSQMQQYRARL